MVPLKDLFITPGRMACLFQDLAMAPLLVSHNAIYIPHIHKRPLTSVCVM